MEQERKEQERRRAQAEQLHQERLRQAEIERRAKKAEEEKKEKERLQKEAYRRKPNDVKLAQLQNALGIETDWPEFLEVEAASNRFVDVPAQLWQAGIFKKFLLNKPLGTSIAGCAVTAWVKDWFCSKDPSVTNLQSAMRQYLTALQDYGFVDATRSYDDDVYYRLRFNKVAWPPRPRDKNVIKQKMRQHFGLAAPLNVKWNFPLPPREMMATFATKRTRETSIDFIGLTKSLYQCAEMSEAPYQVAMDAASRGFDFDVVFEFMLDAGLLRR
jgi:hypothetical protein